MIEDVAVVVVGKLSCVHRSLSSTVMPIILSYLFIYLFLLGSMTSLVGGGESIIITVGAMLALV